MQVTGRASRFLVFYSFTVTVFLIVALFIDDSEQNQSGRNATACPVCRAASQPVSCPSVLPTASPSGPIAAPVSLPAASEANALNGTEMGPPPDPQEISLQQEAEEQQQEMYRDMDAERALAYLQDTIGLQLTVEQEQRAIAALRSYGEADASTRAAADTALISRKLQLSGQQREQIREAITDFLREPEEVTPEMENNSIQPELNQNEEYLRHIERYLNPKQKTQLRELFENGMAFLDE